MRDTSLEDFLGDSDDEPEPTSSEDGAESGSVESAPERTVDPEEEGETGDEPIEPGPAAATYAWAPGGADCADCGTTVERRWRDGDRFVCADCKEW